MSRVLTLLVLLCCFLGCEEPPPPPPSDSAPSSGPAGPAAEQAGPGKIYVDSVPRGALVRIWSSATQSVDEGPTPRYIDSSRLSRPGSAIEVRMNMEQYGKQVAALEGMAAWFARFKEQEAKGQTPLPQLYFVFDSEDEDVQRAPSGAITSISAKYRAPSNANAIRVMFIPRDMPREVFFPLMPAEGTYPLPNEEIRKVLRWEYGFSEQQLRTVTECMVRCGKYVATSPNRERRGSGWLIAVTHDEPAEKTTLNVGTLARMTPGVDDNP